MEHYKLRMSEHQFKERVSQIITDVRFNSQISSQLFFDDQSFVIKPKEQDPDEYVCRGEYQSDNELLDLRLSFPDSPQRTSFFNGKLFKLLVIGFLFALAFSLLIFSMIAYMSIGLPFFTLISILVIANVALGIIKNLNTTPDTLFFEERFMSLFKQDEIIKLK